MNDRWSLDYDADWVATPAAFPLSPALPFHPPAEGYAAGAVKRFVENLLPEGRALDITATTLPGLQIEHLRAHQRTGDRDHRSIPVLAFGRGYRPSSPPNRRVK